MVGALLAFFIVIYLAASNDKRNTPLIATNKLPVVTSFYPLYYFASQIGGDKANVFNITPAGAEPHDYEPTTQDLARIEASRLLILNGGKLEAWGDRVRDTLHGTKVTVAAVGEVLVSQQINENGITINDPHVWLSPVLAKKEVGVIADNYKQVDPANAALYETNATELINRLEALDRDFRESLGQCTDKNIVTSHAAFGYLAREYGLRQLAISGLSPDEEPTVQKLADIANFVKNNHVKYIFFENLMSPKLAQTIAGETGTRTLTLNPLEGLTSQDIVNGQNYFTVMKENLINLKTALDCK